MKAILLGFIERFKEPSSWAGIGVLLASLGIPEGLMQSIFLLASGLAGGIAFLLKEKKPAQ